MNVFMTIILICEAQAYYDQIPDTANVGTVLFTQSDLYNKRWSKDKIKILQARKYLQDVIPSPRITKSVNEEYLTNLLTYFKEAYRTVKREAKDPDASNAMNIALSDALGGFLKIWVLPITKYAFYGGTVSLEQAIDTFQVYDDIKRNLKTDGRKWRSPNENLLKYVAIDVALRPRSNFPRCIKDPCKHLAYYEKTDTDLTVPLPVINWDILPITIFVPLKNQSIVPIASENSSKILFHYYDIAENCMQSQSPANLNDFNQKFQKWLSKDVTPHLKDDNLYLAFGSILSLINDTKSFPGTLSYACSNNFENLKFKAKSLATSMCNSSKKYLILTLIVLVEVMWCLPSLFYIIRLRRRKRNENTQGYFFGFFRKKPKETRSTVNHSKQSRIFKYNYFSNTDHTDDQGVKISVKPRVKQLKVDAQCPSCDSKYMSIKSSKSNVMKLSNEQVNIVNEVPLKSSLKKKLPEFDTSYVGHNSSKRSITNKNDNTKDKMPKSLNQVSTKTMMFIQGEKTVKEINYSQESSIQETNNHQSQQQCACSSNNDKNNNRSFNLCPCTSCLKDDKQCTEIKNKKLHLKSKFEKFRKNIKTTQKTMIKTEVDKNLQIKQNVDKNNNRRAAENSRANFDKPLLRIRIDKPKTEIRVGISNFKEHSSRPSKIPRLAKRDAYNLNNENKYNFSEKAEKLYVNNLILRKRNLRRTLDDTAIKRTTTIDKKLNVTL